MNILEKLFGSPARVKLLRFFLLSPEKIFTPKEAARLLRVPLATVSREIRFLKSAGFLKRTTRNDEILKKSKRRTRIVRKKIKGFALLQTFPYLLALRNLLVTASPVSREKLLKFFKNKGKIKLLVLGGVFAGDFAQDLLLGMKRLDLLVVGTAQRKSVEKFVKKVEAEVGKELNWTLFTAPEFEHRLAMHDKLLRDLFDYPHEFLINKMPAE